MIFKRLWDLLRGTRHDYGLDRQSMWDKVRRHAFTFFHYNSPKKLLNLLAVFLQGVFRLKKIRGRPFIIKIESTVRCNLRCHGCVHGTAFPLSNRDMPLEMFKRICDELGDYLYKISLYIIGEPLLCPSLYEMISYASARRIGTVISSNFHAMDEQKAEQLIRSGLSHLIIALDAMDQGVYEQVRVGGHVERVLRNIEIFMRRRSDLGSRLPFVELQTIRNDLTRPQIPRIAEFARRMGIDRYTIRDDVQEFSLKPKNKACFWLWHTLLINEDGMVLPCCPAACTPEFMESELRDFGNIMNAGAVKVWNSPRYIQARGLFSFRRRHHLRHMDKDAVPICFYCGLFRTPDRIRDDARLVGLPVPKIFR